MTEVDFHTQNSVQAAVRRAAHRFGDRPAVGLPGRVQSFTQTYDRTLRLASALESLGAAPGTRIALLASNGPWYFELHFAVCESGLVLVPVNGRFTAAEQLRYLAALNPHILITDSEHVLQAKDLVAALPSIRHVIGIGENHGAPLDYDRVIAAADPAERPLRDVNEPVIISATSGTSGEAKAVLHTQRSTASAYAPLIERFEIDEHAHFVTGLAMYFATAYAGWTASFIAGAQHTIMPSFSPRGWVEQVEQSEASHGFLGPTPVYMIMDSGVDLTRLRGLRYLSMGGSRCDPSRLRALTEVLGSRVALQLSMTELGAGTVLLGPEYLNADGSLDTRHRSVGRPVGGLEVRIVDDGGHPLSGAAGTTGELQLRGPMVSPGYLGNPEANVAAYREGWFCTGDLVSIDDDGYIFVLDRKKDLIVSGGINIAPAEIEQVLMSHPAVAAAGACGMPDSLYGEAVHAAVTLRAGASATIEELARYSRDRLASAKKPRRIVIVDELPVSSTGKLLRRRLGTLFDQA